MKNHSTQRLASVIALTAFWLIPRPVFAQTEVTAWTTNEGTTFWAHLGGWDGKQLILMARGRDFRIPVSRFSAKSLDTASRMLGVPEKRLRAACEAASGVPKSNDAVAAVDHATPRQPESSKPLKHHEYYSSVLPELVTTSAAALDQSSSAVLAAPVAPVQTEKPAAAKFTPPTVSKDAPENAPPAEPGNPDLGRGVLAFCKRHLGIKVGNGQCATLAAEALESAGAAGMGRDFPKRGDYVWGEQVALLEHGRREIEGLETLAKVRPGDIIQFRDVRLVGRNSCGGTYTMNADHHTAVVATADPDKAVLTYYHQNWGRKIVKQDQMQLKDLQSGWMRIYRPVDPE